LLTPRQLPGEARGRDNALDLASPASRACLARNRHTPWANGAPPQRYDRLGEEVGATCVRLGRRVSALPEPRAYLSRAMPTIWGLAGMVRSDEQRKKRRSQTISKPAARRAPSVSRLV
jgi:hypothetical protein